MRSRTGRFLILAAAAFLIAGFPARVHSQPPSFTFAGTVPSTIVDGSSFTFPASITDTGGPAVDDNSFFQIYNSNFQELTQTYYTGQTWASGQTLDYSVPMTAPSTTGFYYIAGFVFDTTYTGPILGQQFFATFNTVPAVVPEMSSGVSTGLLILGLMGIALLRRKSAGL